MLIHRIYLVQNDDKDLIYISALHADGNCVQSVDLHSRPALRSAFEYDGKGRLIQRVDRQDGMQETAQQFVYDQDGEIAEESLLFDGTVYDKTVLEKTEHGFVHRHFQDGEEVERMEKVVSGKNWTQKFFRESELMEVQEYTYDDASRFGTMHAHSLEFNWHYSVEEYFNENDQLIRKMEFGEDRDRQSRIEVQYMDQKVVSEHFEDFISGDSWTNAYAYDDEGRLIKFECRSKSGELYGFRTAKYNDAGQLIEEAGRNASTHFRLEGYHTQFDIYHLLHAYSEGDLSALNEPS